MCVDVVDEKYQAINMPKPTIHSGDSFINKGRINIDWLTGESHITLPPAQIDRMAKNSIGLIIFLCSTMLISGALDLDLHMVTNLNRIE